VIGPTGRNFAAGMSGGIAFVLNEDGLFEQRCNTAMVDLESVEDEKDLELLELMLRNHAKLTGSTVAQRILNDFDAYVKKFVKVMPRDFRRALQQLDEEERARAEAKLVPIPA
jgi:glutamate synthase domain-containing protein 3